MKVKELMKALEGMPQDAVVLHVWDGAARTEINYVWLARNGCVVTADHNEVVYDDKDRPVSASTTEQDRYWRTPDEPTRAKE